MSDQISYTQSLGVASSAPSGLSASGNASIEAYDRINVSIPITTPTVVDVGPEDAILKAIMIKASSYATPLTFIVDEVVTERTLDSPLLLVGAGQLALLGPTCKEITFTNTSQAAIVVDILVGRSAIEVGA